MKKPKKNGFSPIAPKLVSACIKHVEKAFAAAPEAPIGDANARRRLLKPKKGAATVIPTIAMLLKKYGLEGAHLPVDVMTARMQHTEQLRTLLGTVTVLRQRLKDEILRSDSEAWEIAIASYGALKSASVRNTDLATELTSVEQWFRKANGRAKSAPSAPPAAEAPAPPAQAGSLAQKPSDGAADTAAAAADHGVTVVRV